MGDLTPFRDKFLIPNHDVKAAGIVRLVAGSGLGFQGDTALVVFPNSLAVIAPDGQVLKKVPFDGIIRLRECEFNGLVEIKDTPVGEAMIAPNERSGFEVVYKSGGEYERTIRVLTYFAGIARDWLDTINGAIEAYWDKKGRDGRISK